jgi:hypothetical protein
MVLLGMKQHFWDHRMIEWWCLELAVYIYTPHIMENGDEPIDFHSTLLFRPHPADPKNAQGALGGGSARAALTLTALGFNEEIWVRRRPQ